MSVDVSGPGRRFALFIRSLGGGGGAERAVVQLAGGLASRGLAVDLLLARAEGPFLSQVPADVRVIDLGVRGAAPAIPHLLRSPATAMRLVPAALTQLPWVFGAIPALVDYFERERPAALLSALDYTNFTALLAARSSRLAPPVVVIEQNTLGARARSRRHWRWRFLPQLARHFYPFATARVGVSRGVSRDLAAVLGSSSSEVATLFNPVVSDATANDAKAPLGHPWFREGEPPVVLAAGKLKAQKGFDTLLRAFALLRAERDARLVILGEGPERRRLLRLARRLGIEEDIALPGFVANPFAYMSRAGVFALSSRFEGLPSTLIEAMACGCPVVSTDCDSGPREILEGGRLGRLVPVDAPGALSRAVGEALAEEGDASALRERAAVFSVGRAVEAYLALLRSLGVLADEAGDRDGTATGR